MAFKGDDFMKTNSERFEQLKTFCIATLSFYCITFVLYIFAAICWLIQGGLSLQLYEVFMMALSLLTTIGAVLSFLWLFITLIWCAIICKKEHNNRFFFKPVIITNLVLSTIFPLIIFWKILQ